MSVTINTSLGNAFDFQALVGTARAGIDTKHKESAIKVSEKVMQVDKNGVISYGKHNVDMTKEGDTFSTLQLGARSAKGSSQKAVANTLTIEQSNGQALVATEKFQSTATMRCVGIEQLGKNKHAIVFIDTAGTKTTIELQGEILADREEDFATACALGSTEALVWLQENLLSI